MLRTCLRRVLLAPLFLCFIVPMAAASCAIEWLREDPHHLYTVTEAWDAYWWGHKETERRESARRLKRLSEDVRKELSVLPHSSKEKS